MGLDMYLSARISTSEYFEKEINLELRPIADKCLPPAAQSYDSIEIERQVAYWRKANQIHRWFVENVQDGTDDCGTYDVQLEQLRELRDICQQVIDGSTLKPGIVNNGYRFEGGQQIAITEPGNVIIDTELAKSLLPPQEGFFFGNTDYNEWYLDDLKDTIDQLERILGWAAGHMRGDPGKQYCPIDFKYHSSW
jgi:hypothetical protein